MAVMAGAAFVLLLVAAGAVAQTPCTHTTYDVDTGNQIYFGELSRIAPIEKDQDIVVEDSLNPNYRIFFRICDTVKDLSSCNSNDPNTAACQNFTGSPGRIDSLGTLPSMVILDYPTSDHSLGVLFEYSDGSLCADGVNTRRILITAECDPTGSAVGSTRAYNHPPESPEPCNYEVWLSSIYACPSVGPGVCTSIADCTSCGLVEGCGWCSLSQSCVPGDNLGPNSGSCSAQYWHYNATTNPCINCPSISGCSQCSSVPDCRYCSETGGCQAYNSVNCLGETVCTCPACTSGTYCPDNGGQCVGIPNTAGLFVGGLFLGLGLVGIGGAIYYFWSKRQTTYTGLA